MELWARTSSKLSPHPEWVEPKRQRESEQVFAYIFHCLADLHRDDI